MKKKIPNLKEIYDSGSDLRDSYIPEEWRDSFDKFIRGQTCYMSSDESGKRDFVYYSRDFKIWYNQNKEAIERDIKINDIIE